MEKLQVYFDKKVTSQGTSPYELLATLLKEQGHESQLLPKLEALHKAQPGNVPLTYFLAQRYAQLDKPQEAIPLFRGLIDGNKRPPAEAYLGLIDIYRRQHDTAALLAVLGDVVSRTGTLAALGDQAKALEADTDAITALIEFARKQRAGGTVELNYGQCLTVATLAMAAKQYDTAGEFFGMAAKAEPTKAPDVMMKWGLGLLLANEPAAASRVLERAVTDQLLPAENPAFQFYLAGALELAGRTDESLEYARRAAALSKDDPRIVSRVGWIQFHAKRYEEARKNYLALLEKFDGKYDSDEVRESLREARLALSNIDVSLHRMPEAEEWLEQVLDEYPEDVGAMNDLGYLWADQGQHLQRALGMIQAAVKAEPKNMAYLDSLGWALFRLGRYPEAVAALKSAAAEQPDPTVLEHLADAQEKNGELPAAIENWKAAIAGLEKDPGNADKAKAIREKLDRAQAGGEKPAEPKR